MKKIVLDKDLLYKKYVIEDKTIPVVASEFNVCHTVISKNLEYYGIPSKSNKIEEIEKEILIRLYIENHLSIRDIAKHLGVAETQIRKSLKFHNIARRMRYWKSSQNKKGKIVSCAVCGKEIYRKNYNLNKFNVFFCSWDCLKIHQSITKSISELPESWRSRKDYRSWRRKILQRDNRTCKMCESIEKPIAHHIVEAKERPDLKYEITNGITLCQKCHIEVHKNNSHNYIESLQKAISEENPNIGENPEMDNPEASIKNLRL